MAFPTMEPPLNTAKGYPDPSLSPPSVSVPTLGVGAGRADPETNDPPVRTISPDALHNLGQRFNQMFLQYVSDRRIAELRWLANQRQYLGIYDPEVEKALSPNRSKAYPKLTRTKCISVLSKIMNLMFQGNERNWEIHAAPWPDITAREVREALGQAQRKDQDAGVPTPSLLTEDYVLAALENYAAARAEKLAKLIDDQLQELGGHQALDYVALNRAVIRSGIMYGLGVLRGPFVRRSETVTWRVAPVSHAAGPSQTMQAPQVVPQKKTVYKPHFEFLPVWDFYPDMSAKTLQGMDGYFVRHVMSKQQVKKLGEKPDFFEDVIDAYLAGRTIGNYRPQPFELELRVMGVKVNVNEMKSETSKYEVIVWHGPVDGHMLQGVGVEVPQDRLSDSIDAEIWTLDANVIAARLNPWEELSSLMPSVPAPTMVHTFLFDEDDTSLVGFGLPQAVRDSQMMVSASTRMLLDNASIVCGPQLEANRDLLVPDQDVSAISAYKIWLREGDGPEAQWPAVRNVSIDAHLADLLKIVDLGQRFADSETFVGPATGGDMERSPSEPMRTAAGASMLRGEAALPFKDIIRSFDSFTQSVIHSMVLFNRLFNSELAPDGDYDVVARGATSLMAKELRGMQADSLVQTLRPEQMVHVDERKLTEAQVRARDMDDILVTVDEASRRQQAAQQVQQEQQDQQTKMLEATIRKTLADAFKNIAQGQKNTANADAQLVDTALDILERGVQNELSGPGPGPSADGGVGAGNGGAVLPGAASAGGPAPGGGLGAAPASGAGYGGNGASPPATGGAA